VSEQQSPPSPTIGTSAWQRQFLYFATAICIMAFANGMAEPIFNNYVIDVFHLSAKVRGALEFPRELPGFLVAVFAGALFFLTEVRMATFAALLTTLGLCMLCFQQGGYALMVVSMIIWSAGQHLLMPLQDTIGLTLAGGKNAGSMLGRIGGLTTAASIVASAVLWIASGYLHLNYPSLFAIAVVGGCLATVAFLRMKPLGTPRHSRPKLVFKRRYSLYYLLCVLFGARKQVFLTFGPLVLITLFHQPVATFAKLRIIAAVGGILFRPALGWMIDHLGERFVLMADSAIITIAYLGYGLAPMYLGKTTTGLYLVYACYILDMLFFAMEMARSVYMNKIAEKREDVAPSLTLGVSLNHAVSMSIPALGGIVWAVFGYQWVFIGAAVIAVITVFASSLIRVPSGLHADMAEAEMELGEER
jgi:hypothetical protein